MFQCKLTTLNFLTCANLHMIEKPSKNYFHLPKTLVFKATILNI